MKKTNERERPRSLEEYLELRYPTLLEDDDGAVLASHPDLPGCMAEADTTDDALRLLSDARRMWIATRLEDGLDVPEPMSDDFSGRTVVRMSRALHGSLARLAGEQGVSLNTMMVEALSAHVARISSNLQLATFRKEILAAIEQVRGSAAVSRFPSATENRAAAGGLTTGISAASMRFKTTNGSLLSGRFGDNMNGV